MNLLLIWLHRLTNANLIAQAQQIRERCQLLLRDDELRPLLIQLLSSQHSSATIGYVLLPK
jgi:hypothetical protein